MLISPPTPVIDIFHPASVRVQSQPIVTEIAGSSDPSGFHHDSLPPTEAFGQLVPVSSHSTGSAAALVPLLSLSSIPKADLDLLHALKTPDNVPYLVDLPASLSTKLQTGVHSDVVHTDASQTASTVPISQTPTTVIASNAPAPQISPAEATATTPSAHSASSVLMTDMGSVLAAVQQFQNAAAQPALVVTDHVAIFYDAAATSYHYGAVTSVTYDFGDGFSISLVGLPSELPHASMHG